MPIDLAIDQVVTLTTAGQAHLDETIAMHRLRRLVGVALAIFPVTEEVRGQQQAGAPEEHPHHPSGAASRRLLCHGRRLQPPLGAAKRQTMGRSSPSARVWLPLSTPIQAPSLSIHSASAMP